MVFAKKQKVGEIMKKFMKTLPALFLSGILIAIICYCFQLITSGVIQLAFAIFSFDKPINLIYQIPLIFILGIILAIASNDIIQKNRFVSGSGIPQLEGIIRHRFEPPHPFLTICYLFLNSLITFFCGLSLGGEGPSVSMGGYLALWCYNIYPIHNEEEQKEMIAAGCGVGFGCALLAPISGIIYTFEESLHSFSWKGLYKVFLMMITAYGILCLFHGRLLLSSNIIFDIKDSIKGLTFELSFLYCGVAIISILIGFIFLKLYFLTKDWIEKHSDHFIYRYRLPIIFIFSLFIILFFPLLSGSGLKLFQQFTGKDIIIVILIILLVKMFLIFISSHSSATGGMVIPILTLGMLAGWCYSLILININLIEPEQSLFIVILTTLTTFSVINLAPLTSISLMLSILGPAFFSWEIIIPTFLVIGFSYFICKTFLESDFYDSILWRMKDE